ncbi:hypothetical protein [Mucilaginibacter antarcticus]|uniref:hypothetical protein n=1 Tax=Mucilaginibacter antarcticus TaxID=1855725 RepID=UPI0036261318
MLNRVVSIFLLVTLISTNFSRFFIYAGFQVNKSYIAAQLCENKARPWMNCNGSCFLMKKLKAAEEKEKNRSRKQKEPLPGSPGTSYCYYIYSTCTNYILSVGCNTRRC